MTPARAICKRCGREFGDGGHGPGMCIDRRPVEGVDVPCEHCLDPMACADDVCPETVFRGLVSERST